MSTPTTTSWPQRLRAVGTIYQAAFRADPLRATLSVVLPIGVGGAVGVQGLAAKLVANGIVGHAIGEVAAGVALIVAATAVQLVLAVVGLLASERVAETTGHRIERELIELTLGIDGLELLTSPEVADRLAILRQSRWSFGATISAVSNLITLATGIASVAGLLATVSPVLLLLPLASLPALYIALRSQLVSNRWNDRNAEAQRERSELFDLVTSPPAAGEIRSFGLGGGLTARFVESDARLTASMNRVWLRLTRLSTLASLVPGVGFVLALALVVHRLQQGQASVGDVAMTTSLAASVSELVSPLGGVLSESGVIIGHAGRLSVVQRLVQARVRSTGVVLPQRLRDGIRFESVSFRYPDGREALREVNAHLPAGSTIAIVGENGAGKSTMIALLLGLYAPTSGRITVDGIDLATVDRTAWRAACAGAFQDHLRWELPLRDGVGVGDLGHLDDDERIKAAIDRGAAKAVLDDLPRGLDSVLGDSWDPAGEQLSGGQWQRLAIARGVMRRDPLLLLLDEPTSALDAETEATLFNSYARQARAVASASNGLTVPVSHRFSTVRTADSVIVLEAGTVTEAGEHAELMARGGTYAELYSLQAAAYR